MKKEENKIAESVENQEMKSNELPSVKMLSERTGFHFFTKILYQTQIVTEEENVTNYNVGCPLVALYCLDKQVTPFLTIEALDNMITGILAVSPMIKAIIDAAKSEQ